MNKKLLLCSALLASLTFANAQTPCNAQTRTDGSNAVEMSQPVLNYNLADDESFIGYCNENDKIFGVGVGKAHYQAAAKFPKETMIGLKGNKITTIRVALYSTDCLEDAEIWIKKDLNAAPVFSKKVSFSAPMGWNDFTLDVPFEIDGEEIYLGYGFNLPESAIETEEDMMLFGHPIAVARNTPQPGSLYMNFDKRQWDDYSDEKTAQGEPMGCLMVQAVVKGGQSVENDVALTKLEDLVMVKNESFDFDCTIINRAQNPVKTLDVKYTIGNITETQTITLEKENRMFETAHFPLTVKAPDVCGTETLTVTVEKLNGVADGNMDDNTQSQDVLICSQRPEYRAVLESGQNAEHEFCVYGEIALERLDKECRDKVICLGVHTQDQYAAESYSGLFDLIEKPLPYGVLNRSLPCNPYYGVDINGKSENFGIKHLVDEVTSRVTVADIDVVAPFADDSQTAVNATAKVTFRINSADASNYRVAYVLVEDKVSGTQTNVFAGRDGLSEDFAPYGTKPATIKDFVFNDMARSITDFEGIAGSMVGAIEADAEKQHTQRIDLTPVTKVANARVVAMLIDTNTNTIVNAEEVAVGGTSGIEEVKGETFVPEVTVKEGVIRIASDCDKTLVANVYSAAGNVVAEACFENNAAIAMNGYKGVYLVRVSDGNHVAVYKVVL